MRKILAGTNVEALIGAGIQGPLDPRLDLELLGRAVQISPTNPLAWAAIAYRNLNLCANGLIDSRAAERESRKAVETLRKLVPGNSLPVYLQAAFAGLQTNFAAAKTLIVKASHVDGFDPYDTPLKTCVIKALESAGRSKYTARMVACGSAPGIVAWSKLSQAILAASPTAEEVRGCAVLGSRLAGGRSFLEQLVGWSVQRKAMEKLGEPGFAAEQERIAEKKQRIKTATRYLDSARRTGRVTEVQWVEYYDRCFSAGEMEAARWLAEKMGDKF